MHCGMLTWHWTKAEPDSFYLMVLVPCSTCWCKALALITPFCKLWTRWLCVGVAKQLQYFRQHLAAPVFAGKHIPVPGAGRLDVELA